MVLLSAGLSFGPNRPAADGGHSLPLLLRSHWCCRTAVKVLDAVVGEGLDALVGEGLGLGGAVGLGEPLVVHRHN